MVIVTSDENYIQEFYKLHARIIFWVGLIVLTFTSSCKSLSEIGSKNTHILTISKDDFNKLNGTYSNSFDTTFGKVTHSPYDGRSDVERLTVLNQLFNNYPESAWRDESGKIIDPKEKWVKIEFNSRKIATVSMYHNDKFIFSKNIHGKFKNGYFYLRPKVYIIPFFPLIFAYCFERVRIGKTKDDYLAIDYRTNNGGFALIAGGSERGSASSIYEKKKY